MKAEDKKKLAYCKEIGSDSIIGLDSCDDYKDWLSNLDSKSKDTPNILQPVLAPQRSARLQQRFLRTDRF